MGNPEELRRAMSKYEFYHIIELAEGVSTPGNPVYVPAQRVCMKYLESLDLQGKRVLDIGCRDGLFSLAAERLGAADVIGIDNDLSIPATEFILPHFGSKVRMEEMNLYDLRPESFGLFDAVVFPGVLYHLRYPFTGLKSIRDIMRVGGDLIVETAIWRGDEKNAMLFCPIDDDSPYESTSCTFYNEKGLVDTLTTMGFETLSVEYVPQAHPNMLSRISGSRGIIGTVFPWISRPIRRVVRGVFHAKYRGHDGDSFDSRYWESTHSFHTEHGG